MTRRRSGAHAKYLVMRGNDRLTSRQAEKLIRLSKVILRNQVLAEKVFPNGHDQNVAADGLAKLERAYSEIVEAAA